MPTVCSASCCWSREGDKTVGTSINCSAICEWRRSRSTKWCWILSCEILGTSMTNSTGNCVSRDLKKCSSCSPSCGTGASRICTKRQMASSCSMVCRRTRSCAPRGSPRHGGNRRAFESPETWPCSSARDSFLLPWPWWPCSGSVKRRTQRAPCRTSGATLLPGPCGWIAARWMWPRVCVCVSFLLALKNAPVRKRVESTHGSVSRSLSLALPLSRLSLFSCLSLLVCLCFFCPSFYLVSCSMTMTMSTRPVGSLCAHGSVLPWCLHHARNKCPMFLRKPHSIWKEVSLFLWWRRLKEVWCVCAVCVCRQYQLHVTIWALQPWTPQVTLEERVLTMVWWLPEISDLGSASWKIPGLRGSSKLESQLQDWSMCKISVSSHHHALDQRSWDGKVNGPSDDIAIDYRAKRFLRIRYAWCDDCVYIEETSRQASSLPKKSKCRRAACSERRPILTREADCIHDLRAFSSHQSSRSCTRVHHIYSFYADRIMTLRISIQDGTKLY